MTSWSREGQEMEGPWAARERAPCRDQPSRDGIQGLDGLEGKAAVARRGWAWLNGAKEKRTWGSRHSAALVSYHPRA